jgi:hypothetical protein
MYQDFQAPSPCCPARCIKVFKHPHIGHRVLCVYSCMSLCISTGQSINIQENRQTDGVAEAAEGRRSAQAQCLVGMKLDLLESVHSDRRFHSSRLHSAQTVSNSTPTSQQFRIPILHSNEIADFQDKFHSFQLNFQRLCRFIQNFQ